MGSGGFQNRCRVWARPSTTSNNEMASIDPAVFKDALDFVFVPPPRGVTREGPDCRVPSEAGVLGLIRGGNLTCCFYFDLKHSWVENQTTRLSYLAV